MNIHAKVVIKQGTELSEAEIEQINTAKLKEWNVPPLDEEQRKHIIVLIKDENCTILAQGQLVPLEDVIFDNEEFSCVGIGGVIANKKGQGYGRILMQEIKAYLEMHNTTGIGFTGKDTVGFYKRCGFLADYTSLKRFIHMKNGKKITNTTEECVFYFDSEDRFMEKVLSKPNFYIFLPRDPDW